MTIKHQKRLSLISLILALIMLAGLYGCRGSGDGTATSTAPATEPAPTTFSLSEKYTLIYPDSTSAGEKDAVKLLQEGIKSAVGADIRVNTYFVRHGEPVVPGEFEILVGDTNRSRSREAADTLPCLDWMYSIDSPNVITICGGSPEATLEAARAFLSDMFGYEADGSAGTAKELTVGDGRTFRGEYPQTALTLGGVPIEEYTVVVSRDSTVAANVAGSLCRSIEKLTGRKMRRSEPSGFDGGRAIYVGMSGSDGRHFADLPAGAGYIVRESGNDIAIDFRSTGSAAANAAAANFKKAYIPDGTPASADIALGKNAVRGVCVTGSNGLILTEGSSSSLAPGVEYIERLYTDNEGNPVRAYIVSVEKGSAYLYTGTTDDGSVLEGNISTVADQMTAAKNNGKNVVAGFNADFFAMTGSYLPQGLCVKNGSLLHANSERWWFGVLNDGTPVDGWGTSEYNRYKGRFANAVGGSDALMKKGSPAQIASNDFASTRHPRTAVGFDSATGKVFIVAVDGRQPGFSTGASLSDLTEIFFSLGCTDAVNLDGGGSTTAVVRDASGGFVLKNKPSDGSMRRVSTTLLVCLPDKAN